MMGPTLGLQRDSLISFADSKPMFPDIANDAMQCS